jgi:hypothetical protein
MTGTPEVIEGRTGLRETAMELKETTAFQVARALEDAAGLAPRPERSWSGWDPSPVGRGIAKP